MKTYDVVGYVVREDTILCPNCYSEFQSKQNNGLEPFHESVNPIFADSEWDHQIYCEECNEEIDIIVLMHTCSCCKEEKYDVDERLNLCKECKKELKEWAESLEFPNFESFENWQQYAEYSNSVLPKLREYAGYSDPLNVGTYTEGTEDNEWYLDEIFNYWEEHIKIGEDED